MHKCPFKEQLEKRLEAQQEALEKDEKLLEELKKITDKINKESLAEKLEELAKQNKNKQRSLEQLLELTKRYYVTQKADQLQNNLDELAKEQLQLAEEPEDKNTQENQDKINEDFKELTKELDDLRKENEALSKPLELPDDPDLEKSIKKDQENASSDLGEKEESSDTQDQKDKLSNAQKSQKKAGQKMQQMGQQMAQQMSSGGGQQMSEDIDVLRQILDNLLLFSFDQEALMKRFRESTTNPAGHAKRLVKQNNLREHFEHVEDSLFALSLRQPMISESINKEITEVFFNIDKSIDLLSENSVREAVGAQQFAITATNKLADMLSNTLDNMEMQMQMSTGQGEGEMQLPDIIMSQEALSKQMCVCIMCECVFVTCACVCVCSSDLSVEMRLYASADYLKSRGTPQTLEDIANHRLICQNPNAPQVAVSAALVQNLMGYSPKSTLTVNNYFGVLQGVINNLGIGILPDYVTHDFPDLVRVLPKLENTEVPVFLAYPEELYGLR